MRWIRPSSTATGASDAAASFGVDRDADVCTDPLDGHQMFSECFPHGYLNESSGTLHRARLVAV